GRPGGEGRPSVAEVSASADQLVLASHERDAFGAEDCGSVADVEVQVRLGAVTGVAQEAKYLAALNTIPGFHAKAARLQVRVEGVLPLADVVYHEIAADRLERDRNGS